MPNHASARLHRMAGGDLPQNAVAEAKYEIDASIGEDPVPFVAMRGPLEQPNALDEFLESGYRLAFPQLHVFVSRPSPMDRIVGSRSPVLKESDADDHRPLPAPQHWRMSDGSNLGRAAGISSGKVLMHPSFEPFARR